MQLSSCLFGFLVPTSCTTSAVAVLPVAGRRVPSWLHRYGQCPRQRPGLRVRLFFPGVFPERRHVLFQLSIGEFQVGEFQESDDVANPDTAIPVGCW